MATERATGFSKPLNLPLKLQDLPSTSAKLYFAVEHFLTQELGLADDLRQSRVILGLSGGADSTALLLILKCMQPRLGFELCAAHLDHALREESATEAQHTHELCAKLDIPFHSERLQIRQLATEQGIGLEEAGRLARHAFFVKLANAWPTVYPKKDRAAKTFSGRVFICTAHHLNDLAEDLLMRLSRGTGWPALAGMKALRPVQSLASSAEEKVVTAYQVSILRPLLLTPKETLYEFLRQIHCPWLEDASNTELCFKRNRVRGLMMPLFLQENPNFLEHIANLWRLARLDEEHWEHRIKAPLQTQDRPFPELFLRNDELHQHDKATRLRMYKACLEKLGAGQALAGNLFQLDAAWASRSTGKSLSFPGFKKALLEHEGIRFYYDPSSR